MNEPLCAGRFVVMYAEMQQLVNYALKVLKIRVWIVDVVYEM